MPVTLRDVSAIAGVSLSTVSHVINRTRVVSEPARERVEAAIRQTGYTPNSLARSLKTAVTHTIGVAIGDIRNPYFTDVVQALEESARERGYSLLLSDSGDNPEREMDTLRVLVERRVDGLIFAPANPGRAALEFLQQRGVKLVQIDRIADAAWDYVVAGNTAATRQMVRHLCDIGHRRIAMLAGLADLSSTRERIAGFRRGLHDAGQSAEPDLIVAAGSRSEPARAATLALMRSANPPTALVAGNNLMALGAMRALRERGLAVPQDVALVAFDDFEWADLFSPRLTTIAQPCRQIGETAVRLLLERIHAPDLPPRHVRLPAVMQHRDSCGCHLPPKA
jgi:LacI family transcriptional regulator